MYKYVYAYVYICICKCLSMYMYMYLYLYMYECKYSETQKTVEKEDDCGNDCKWSKNYETQQLYSVHTHRPVALNLLIFNFFWFDFLLNIS